MAEAASSQTPATVSTPSSSAAGTVAGPVPGPQDSALHSHSHSVNGSQNGLDNSVDSSIKAPKDRNCPFCNQAFTSSSLGRHLDLYIKPKNPKPPDGLHDVEKIKLMRGGITRRQPRNSLRASANNNSRLQHDDDAASDRGTPTGQWARRMTISSQDTAGGASSALGVSPVNLRDARFGLNTTSWRGTGVINNLPPRMPDASSNNRMAIAHSHRAIQPKDQDSQDDAKAAELALRELVDSLEAARRRVSHQHVFSFDFCSMNFPSLCLHVLPAPQTLFSMTPFASSDSWSLDAPSDAQLDSLQRQITQRVQQTPTPVPEKDVRKLQMHLQAAWNNWSPLSDKDKSTTWGIEILRAFARADQRSKEKDDELDKAKQEIAHLKEQCARVSNMQLPREYLLQPPVSLPLDPAIVSEMLTDDQSRGWDYDRMISRWRGAVKASKLGDAVVAHHPTPNEQTAVSTPTCAPAASTRNLQSAPAQLPHISPYDVRANQAPLQNGPASVQALVPRQPGAHQIDDDEDADADADADADGEDAPLTNAQHWGSHPQHSFNDSHMGGMANTNGKRPLPPFDRSNSKNMKMYHDSSLSSDTDVFGTRAIGQV